MTKHKKIPPKLLLDPVCFIALVGGSGLFRRAPGTISTGIAVIIYWYWLTNLPLRAYVAVVLVAFLMGVAICHYTVLKIDTHDHPSIGWDEVVGMWITMIGVRGDMLWLWLLLGFLLFRLFDIYKPYPISYLDRHLSGGLGVMLDDVLAGVYACFCLHILILLHSIIFSV